MSRNPRWSPATFSTLNRAMATTMPSPRNTTSQYASMPHQARALCSSRSLLSRSESTRCPGPITAAWFANEATIATISPGITNRNRPAWKSTYTTIMTRASAHVRVNAARTDSAYGTRRPCASPSARVNVHASANTRAKRTSGSTPMTAPVRVGSFVSV